jgi:hypothetical protein
MKPYQQLLLDTADWLERHGWCQGTLRIGEAGCIVAAFGEARRAGKYRPRTLSRAYEYLGNVVGRPVSSPWNDSLPASTGAQTVIAALRKAAA